MNDAPYGPQTAAVRRFLVRLAGLAPTERAAIAARFATVSTTRAFERADAALAEAVERSGRGDARDALSGPLLQLLRRPGSATAVPVAGRENTTDALDDYDPVAEAVLSAALALLVQDLLVPAHFTGLYAACAESIPLEHLIVS